MKVLLDNGHGGIIDGRYQTAGKRSPKWADGSQIFEGEFNRAIVNRIIEGLTRHKIPYVNIVPEYRDISLRTRVKRANQYYSPTALFISVHANAGGGRGSEIYTTPGQYRSDRIATIFGQEFKREFPDERLRKDIRDGDLDKERRYYMLVYTKMSAILTESFFMDNERECKKFLMTREGRDRIADYHLKGILRTKKEIFKQ